MCGGWRFSGSSGSQCAGFYSPEMPLRVWCSVERSSRPHKSGAWEWHLQKPFEWQGEAPSKSKPSRAPDGFTPYATHVPGDLAREGGWRRTGQWVYRRPDPSRPEAFAACLVQNRFDWDPEHGECPRPRSKEYRPGIFAGDREGGPLRWGMPAHARVPFALDHVLPGLAQGLPLYVVEGEKSAWHLICASRMREIPERLVATCNPGGSRAWREMPDPTPYLTGARDVRVIADRDAPGLAWARDVAATFRKVPSVSRFAVFHSATTGEGDDVVDHLEAGYPLSALVPIDL